MSNIPKGAAKRLHDRYLYWWVHWDHEPSDHHWQFNKFLNEAANG